MKKISNMSKRMAAIVCLILISVYCVAHKAEVKREFVLLIYMNGSNLESKSRLATGNIEEILHAMPPDMQDEKFAVLLLMGGTRQWHLDKSMSPQTISSDSITYAKITNNGFQKICSLQNQSIGTTSTLTEFINYGMKEFPADRYGLIFWNHGAGSVTGFGYDELHPNDESLSLSEIREGLQSSYSHTPRKLEFIGFDACLMATLETASAISPYAGYMVASQELEPGKGWNYKSLTTSLSRDPKIPTLNLCRTIVDSFVENYKEKEQEEVTLSVTDLSKVQGLTAKVGELAKSVSEKLSDEKTAVDTEFYRKISDYRTETKSFGMPALTYYGPDMVDVLDFCRHIGKTTNQSLTEAIEKNVKEAVIYSGRSENLSKEQICGLSLYFPCYNLSAAKSLGEYYRCGFSGEYLDFVKTFSQKLLSGNSEKKVAHVVKDDSTTTLSTDMILKTRKIYSIVLASKGDKWVTYGLDADGVMLDHDGRIVKQDNNGITMEKWDKKWINIGGYTVSAYMTLSNKDALVYTVPVYLNNELVDLILRYDSNNPSGKVFGARRITNNQIPDKGMIEIKANDTIVLLHERFDDDDLIDYIPSNDTIIVRKKKDVKVKMDIVPEGTYRYGYCLIDLYGRKYYTRFTDYKVE